MAEKCFVLNRLFSFVVVIGLFRVLVGSMFGTFALTTGDLGSFLMPPNVVFVILER